MKKNPAKKLRSSEPFDEIAKPKHYNSSKAHCSVCGHMVECIDITRHTNFNIGNVIKYLWRTEHKDGIIALRKAAWYLNDEIKRLEQEKVVHG